MHGNPRGNKLKDRIIDRYIGRKPHQWWGVGGQEIPHSCGGYAL